MGLLEAAINAVSAKLNNQATGSGNTAIDGLVAMLDSGRAGGIEGLIQSFTDKGLGEIVNSWVGSGENLPIAPEQIKAALGQEQVAQYAQQTGTTPDAAADSLAQLLPGLIDKLTPNGNLPSGKLLAQALSLFQAKIGGNA